MTEVTQTLRHYCRNPRCRSKLPSPASDPHKAFCTPGCHSSFYLKRCLVCENDKPAGSTARRKLCRRPKCEGRYRKNTCPLLVFWAQIPLLRRTYQEVPNPRALKVRVWTTDHGISLLARKSVPAVYHCAAQPLDPETARRINAANDWGRIRKRLLGPSLGRLLRRRCNRIGSRASPSVPVADDLSIPDFLKREPVAFSESPDGILEAAE